MSNEPSLSKFLLVTTIGLNPGCFSILSSVTDYFAFGFAISKLKF